MQMRVLSRFSPISGPYVGIASASRDARPSSGVCRSENAVARTNDAEDNDRSSVLTPKEIKRSREISSGPTAIGNANSRFYHVSRKLSFRFSRFRASDSRFAIITRRALTFLTYNMYNVRVTFLIIESEVSYHQAQRKYPERL